MQTYFVIDFGSIVVFLQNGQNQVMSTYCELAPPQTRLYFIDALCLPADHVYFQQLQRDSIGTTKWFRVPTGHASHGGEETYRGGRKGPVKVAKKMARLAAVGLRLDEAKISKMLDDALKEQLEVYRSIVQDKNVALKSHSKGKTEHLVEVLAAFEHYGEAELTSHKHIIESGP